MESSAITAIKCRTYHGTLGPHSLIPISDPSTATTGNPSQTEDMLDQILISGIEM